MRDNNIADLGPKPTAVWWKKWRRDFEGFVDTIGLSWKGASALDSAQLSEAFTNAKKRKDKTPAAFGFDFAEKADILYRLIMPKLDDVMSIEFAQTGDENGFELSRQLTRKIDPPRADLAFDFKTEIEGLGNHVCSSFA